MFDDVIAFISKDYDEFKNSGEVQGELSKYKYGYIDNNTIVYELEKIKQKSEGYKNGKNLKIAKQCNKLGDAIDDLYCGWNKMYSFLINNYDKKEVSKLFGMGE
jgi:spermidine/putrescine-binding protein